MTIKPAVYFYNGVNLFETNLFELSTAVQILKHSVAKYIVSDSRRNKGHQGRDVLAVSWHRDDQKVIMKGNKHI